MLARLLYLLIFFPFFWHCLKACLPARASTACQGPSRGNAPWQLTTRPAWLESPWWNIYRTDSLAHFGPAPLRLWSWTTNSVCIPALAMLAWTHDMDASAHDTAPNWIRLKKPCFHSKLEYINMGSNRAFHVGRETWNQIWVEMGATAVPNWTARLSPAAHDIDSFIASFCPDAQPKFEHLRSPAKSSPKTTHTESGEVISGVCAGPPQHTKSDACCAAVLASLCHTFV